MAYLSAHLSDPAQRRRYPDRRPAKAASSRAHLDNPAVWRSAYGEPAAGRQKRRGKAYFLLIAQGEPGQEGNWEKKKEERTRLRSLRLGWGWLSWKSVGW